MKLLTLTEKNNVIQYKWPMIGQYTFYLTNGKLHTGLSLVFLLYDVNFNKAASRYLSLNISYENLHYKSQIFKNIREN